MESLDVTIDGTMKNGELDSLTNITFKDEDALLLLREGLENELSVFYKKLQKTEKEFPKESYHEVSSECRVDI